MNKRTIYIATTILSVSAVLISCNNLTNKTKENINKGGENVGKTATEFFEGVSKGVENTLETELVIADQLKEKGIETGVYEIENDTIGSKNLLTIYIIFKNDLNTSLTAKAINKNGLEIGRAKTTIKGKKGDAKYFDFHFNERTQIGVRSKILIE